MMIMEQPEKIVLWGYHGRGNFGDDLFAEVILEKLDKVKSCRAISTPVDRYGLFTAREVQILNQKRFGFPGETRFRWWKALNCSDTFILGGGNLLDDPEQVIGLHKNLGRRRIRKVALGLGIDTHSMSVKSRLLPRFLDQFSFIALRDERSFCWARDNLEGPSIVKAEDLAYLANMPVRSAEESTPGKVLGVGLCSPSQLARHLKKANDARRIYHDILSAITKVTRQEGYEARFFGFCCNAEQDDAQALRDSERVHEYEIIPYESNTRAFIKAVKSCSTFLSMRLHSAILAGILGIPQFHIPYHEKCRTFAAQAGLDIGRVMDIDDFGVDDFEKRFRAFLDNPGVPCGSMEERIAMAQLNFSFLG